MTSFWAVLKTSAVYDVFLKNLIVVYDFFLSSFKNLIAVYDIFLSLKNLCSLWLLSEQF